MNYPHDHPAAPQPAPRQQPVKPVAAATAANAAARPRQRCSQPMPFDPEELSQKLAKVLIDQKLHAERRRRARAEAAAAAAAAAAAGAAVPQSPLSPTHPNYTSMAREYLDQGSVRPGNRHSMINPATRPRTEPTAIKRKPVPSRDRTDTGTTVHPKSKTPEDNRSSKSKDSSTSKSPPRRKGSSDKHHHYIPQFAATQFARTTAAAEGMPEGKGLVHKLSRTALKIAQAHRERHQPEYVKDEAGNHHNRNDYSLYDKKHHRYTIQGAPAGVASLGVDDHQARAARRLTTGDLLMTWDSGPSSPNPYGYDSPGVPDHDPYEHRVDWTQSDQLRHEQDEQQQQQQHQQQQQAQQQKSKHPLRKADSLWAIKNRWGAFTKHKQEETQQRSRDGSPPSDTPQRSPKNNFFARFKVNH
nr:uncharacterized protein CTRU02_05883 [Colletotrichum truncatum]KAF6793628.1 hypothetical protein CTRU02_05883 [Colletotrichum truncatum]